jgi:hypothetical protein
MLLQALMGRGDYVEAEMDLKRGLAEEPGNADLAALMRKIKVRPACILRQRVCGWWIVKWCAAPCHVSSTHMHPSTLRVTSQCHA